MKIIKKILLMGSFVLLQGFCNFSIASITKVNVDFAQNKIIITGEAIAYPITDSLLVSLGNINLVVCASCYSETEITADIPVDLVDGDYLLKITALGKRYIDSDPGSLSNEYNLTVGAIGPQGIQGEPGIQGVQGLPGADGLNGADGVQGLPGADGAPGIQGVKGDPGIQGFTGAVGPEGPQGLPGADGIQGIQGLRGVPGADGVAGTDGNLALAGQICSSTTVPKGYDANGDIVCGEVIPTATNVNSGKAIMPYWRVFKSGGTEQLSVFTITNISSQALNITVKIYDANANLIKGISPVRLLGVTNINTSASDSSMTFTLNSKFVTQINILYSIIPYDTVGHATIEWSQNSNQNNSISQGLVAHGFYLFKLNGENKTTFSIPINGGMPF
jgi:Collagen triple helix repeat (20 copies)